MRSGASPDAERRLHEPFARGRAPSSEAMPPRTMPSPPSSATGTRWRWKKRSSAPTRTAPSSRAWSRTRWRWRSSEPVRRTWRPRPQADRLPQRRLCRRRGRRPGDAGAAADRHRGADGRDGRTAVPGHRDGGGAYLRCQALTKPPQVLDGLEKCLAPAPTIALQSVDSRASLWYIDTASEKQAPSCSSIEPDTVARAVGKPWR
jgi:hypothetical protein